MRDIRARIAERQGIDLSNQQIQDLAARRLESILDPRAIKPSLLDSLRRNAGAVPPTVAPTASTEPVYSFEGTTIYDSHRAILRFVRRLLNPLLKLFFNPNPVIRALHLQARLNVEAAEREAERDRRQAEWNALHYEILQRLVTDASRLSLELQALTMRVESLSARVDFNDRRVRIVEGASARAGARTVDAPATPQAESAAVPEGPEAPGGESGRRRRRRRRGRRSGAPLGEAGAIASDAPARAHEALAGAPPGEDAVEIVDEPPGDGAESPSGAPEPEDMSAGLGATEPGPVDSASAPISPDGEVDVSAPPAGPDADEAPQPPTGDMVEPTDPDRSEP